MEFEKLRTYSNEFSANLTGWWVNLTTPSEYQSELQSICSSSPALTPKEKKVLWISLRNSFRTMREQYEEQPSKILGVRENLAPVARFSLKFLNSEARDHNLSGDLSTENLDYITALVQVAKRAGVSINSPNYPIIALRDAFSELAAAGIEADNCKKFLLRFNPQVWHTRESSDSLNSALKIALSETKPSLGKSGFQIASLLPFLSSTASFNAFKGSIVCLNSTLNRSSHNAVNPTFDQQTFNSVRITISEKIEKLAECIAAHTLPAIEKERVALTAIQSVRQSLLDLGEYLSHSIPEMLISASKVLYSPAQHLDFLIEAFEKGQKEYMLGKIFYKYLAGDEEASAELTKILSADQLPLALDASEYKSIEDDTRKTWLKLDRIHHEFDNFTWLCRATAPGKPWFIEAFAKYLGANVTRLENESNEHFPGHGVIIDRINPQAIFPTDSNGKIAAAFLRAVPDLDAQILESLSNCKLILMRGIISLELAEDKFRANILTHSPVSWHFTRSNLSLSVFNDHYHSWLGRRARIHPSSVIYDKLGIDRDSLHDNSRVKLNPKTPVSLAALPNTYYENFHLDIGNISCYFGGFNQAYKRGEGPLWSWENTHQERYTSSMPFTSDRHSHLFFAPTLSTLNAKNFLDDHLSAHETVKSFIDRGCAVYHSFEFMLSRFLRNEGAAKNPLPTNSEIKEIIDTPRFCGARALNLFYLHSKAALARKTSDDQFPALTVKTLFSQPQRFDLWITSHGGLKAYLREDGKVTKEQFSGWEELERWYMREVSSRLALPSNYYTYPTLVSQEKE